MATMEDWESEAARLYESGLSLRARKDHRSPGPDGSKDGCRRCLPGRSHKFRKKVERRKLAAMSPTERAAARLRRAEAAGERARARLIKACADVTKYERLTARLRSLRERREREAIEGKPPRKPRIKPTRYVQLEDEL